MSQSSPPQPASDRLALLYQLSQAFNSSLDLDEVLNRVMDEVITAMHAERGFVMLREEDGNLAFWVARGMDQRIIDDPQFQISRSVVEKVAQDGKPVLTSDAQMDTRFNMRQSVLAMGLRAILCVPLRVKEKTLGAIYVDNRLKAGIFTPGDLDLLTAIAANAAIAIENARLYMLAVEQGRIERELQMARKVQMGLLPKEIPVIEGWEFAAHWVPAREVGGDYYDFISLPDNKLGLVIADVTDKGMGAALFMASTRSIIRACMEGGSTPANGIQHASRLLSSDDEGALYVSLFYASLDMESGVIRYINAGHNPPLLVRGDTGEVTDLIATGIWLGVDPSRAYEEIEIILNQGDTLFLYTDGITDATNANNEDFGLDELRKIILDYRKKPITEMKQAVLNAITAHIGDSVPFDDITCVLIRKN